MLIEQIAPGYSPLRQNEIAQNVPAQKWFLHKEMASGNHGLFHITRTGIFADIIAYKEALTPSERKVLHAAILIHDVDRESEGRDPTHGFRRIDYWERHLHLLRANGISLDAREQRMVIALRKFHETNPLNDFQREELGEKGVKLLGILKLADALDRGRDPDQAKHIELDRFNPHLRQIAEEMLPFTQAFIQKTEELRRQGLNVFQTFTHAGKEFGLVTNQQSLLETTIQHLGRIGESRRSIPYGGM